MAINFTKDVEQYTTPQRSVKVKHFTDFTSKKQLEEANVLPQDKLNFVKEIKGTFNFALHEDGRYLAVTLYKATAAERKYNFLIVDLKELAIAEVGSIKEAKAAILELASDKEAEGGDKEEEPEPPQSANLADVNLESVDTHETYIPGLTMEA